MAGTAPFQFATVDQSYRVKKRVCYNVWVGAKGPRIKEKMATGNDQITFVNWDYRPAILVGYEAFAVLRRGEPWKKVDRWDVVNSARVMTETAWRRMFVRKFGHLDVVAWRPMAQDNVPQSKPLPRAKDFDDAARAAQAIDREHRAREATKPKPDYTSIFTSELAWAQTYWTAKWEDTALAMHASWREHKALDAIKHDLETKPTRYGFPGVATLFLSQTLQEVANDAGDQEMIFWATEIERRSRAVIKLYLAFSDPNETVH
jgi:hypothetical protein